MDPHSVNTLNIHQQRQTDPSVGNHNHNHISESENSQQQPDDDSADAKKKRTGPKRRKVTHGKGTQPATQSC